LKRFLVITLLIIAQCNAGHAQNKGSLVYDNSLSNASSLSEWVMEGPGSVSFEDEWMRVHSPQQVGHHVYWCPQLFPNNFVAEWEVKSNNPEAGLCIVFFAAKGLNNESVLSKKLKSRNGTFKQYTKGDIQNYHISYYANTPTQKDRPFAHLRKNPGFRKVYVGKAGIPANSVAIHHVKLIKNDGHIELFIDNESVIDWHDDGEKHGAILNDGYIGFRQMKWTDFSYRNFQVWELN